MAALSLLIKLALLTALASSLPSAVLAAEASSIEGVRIWRSPERTRVVFDLSAPVTYKYFSLAGPERFVIDLQNAKSATDLSELDSSNTSVLAVRGAARSDGRFRLVLDLAKKAAVEPEVFLLDANASYGDRLVVDFYDRQADRNAVASQSNAAPTVTTVPNKDSRRDIIVAIDAGHGGEDPGASGPGKIREKRVVLQISKLLVEQLNKRPGYSAKLIRTGDYYVGLKRRRERARDMGADAFISVHADAFHDKRVRGSSVFTLSADGASSASARFLARRENEADLIGGVPVPDDDMLAGVIWELSMWATMDASANLAQYLLAALKPVAKMHKDTVEHAGFAVLKSPDMPSVLVETGFISNPREAKQLADRKHQQKLAKAIADGVVAYFSEYAVEGTYVYWQKVAGRLERSYKIKAGDTLSEVAARYSLSMASLKSYNGLKSDKIRVGQTIRIPPVGD